MAKTDWSLPITIEFKLMKDFISQYKFYKKNEAVWAVDRHQEALSLTIQPRQPIRDSIQNFIISFAIDLLRNKIQDVRVKITHSSVKEWMIYDCKKENGVLNIEIVGYDTFRLANIANLDDSIEWLSIRLKEFQNINP